MDLVDVGAFARHAELPGARQRMDERVIHPLAIERDVGIGDCAVVATGHEQLFAAIGAQEHQIGARFQRHGSGNVGIEALMNLVAGAACADVDDVVVVVN
jgi:hypothetical protein